MSNIALSTVVIEFIPNLSNLAAEIERQLNNVDFKSIGKEIGRGISKGMQEGIDLQPATGQMDAAAEMLAAAFTGVFADRLTTGVTNAYLGALPKGKSSLAALGAAFKPLGAALLIIAGAIGKVMFYTTMLKAVWSVWGDKLQPLIDVFQNQLARAWERVQHAMIPLRSAWADLMQAIEPLQSIIITALMPAFAGLVGIIHVTAAAISRFINTITGFVQKASGHINIFVGLLTGSEEKVRLGSEQMMQGLLTSVGETFFSALDSAQNFSTLLLSKLYGLGESIFGAANMSMFKEKMVKVFQELYANLPAPIQGIALSISKIGDAAQGAVMSNERLRDAQIEHKIAAENYKSTLNALRMSIDAVRDAENELSGAKLDAEGAALAAERAYRRYNEVLETHCKTSLEAREAAHSLERANRHAEDANNRAELATRNYEGAQRENIKATAVHTRSTAMLASAQKKYKNATAEAERETSRFGDTMQSAGSSLVGGLLSGINSAARTIGIRMSEIARSALSAARNVLGISSPSREFMKIGEGICEGLVMGLNDGLSDVIKAACTMTDAITDAFDVSATTSLVVSSAGIIGTSYSARAARGSFVAAGIGGNTYNTFNTPVTGYHEVLAAQRSAQRQAARR